MEVIHTENLIKYYKKIKGIENVTITVNQGEIFGFLGPMGLVRPPLSGC